VHSLVVEYFGSLIITMFVLQHCQFEMFSYTKDLSTISTDLSSIFIIDNSPGAYKSYPGKQSVLHCDLFELLITLIFHTWSYFNINLSLLWIICFLGTFAMYNAPFSSNGQHLSYDGCLEARGEIIRTVLCCNVY